MYLHMCCYIVGIMKHMPGFSKVLVFDEDDILDVVNVDDVDE